jgi:hypothetical protein
VKPHLGVAVGRVPGPGEQFAHDRLGALELAEIRERVAEVGAVADARREILGIGARAVDGGQGTLEQRHRLPGRPGGRQRAPERRIDVGSRDRRHELAVDHVGEKRDRPTVVAARRSLEPECDARTGRRRDVRVRVGILEQLGQRIRVRVTLDAKGELLLGQPELAELGGVEVRARLEVLGRDAELLGEPAQRLDGRRSRARLDP